MLKFYISLWREYRNVLLDGKLTALNPESDYSQARSTLNNTDAIAVYTNNIIDIQNDRTLVVNASGFDRMIVKNAAGKSFTTKNCKGETTQTGTVKDSVTEFCLPKSGVLIIS